MTHGEALTPHPRRADLVSRYGPPDGVAQDQHENFGGMRKFVNIGEDLVARYHASTGDGFGFRDPCYPTDAITSVLHWACYQGFDPEKILREATLHFSSEAGAGYE